MPQQLTAFEDDGQEEGITVEDEARALALKVGGWCPLAGDRGCVQPLSRIPSGQEEGQACAEAGEYVSALKAFQRALHILPFDPVILELQAQVGDEKNVDIN